MGKRKQTKEQRQKQVISRLKTTNEKLRSKVELLEKKLAIKNQALEDVLLRIAELEEIVFGRKKDKDKDDKKSDESNNSNNKKESVKKRDKNSYKRLTPNENEITETQEYKISDCPLIVELN